MRGLLTVIFVALHGLLLFETPGAFSTVTTYRRSRNPTHVSVRVWLPLIGSQFRTVSSTDRSVSIRRNYGANSAPQTQSSLHGSIRSIGIVDSIIPSGIFAPINAFFKYHPFMASFLICAFKASSADCFAQFMSFKKLSASSPKHEHRDSGPTADSDSDTISSSFSFKRNLALLCYGGLYQGCGQEVIYNRLFSALFGAGTQPRAVLMKVCFDMLVIQPAISLPIAYVIKAPIFGYSLADSMKRYVRDVREKNLLKTCWMVWAPTQLVSFTVIPTHLRISFMACISFFWIIMFSSISSSSKSENTGITTSTGRIKH